MHKILFNKWPYISLHGKNPKGRGFWAFSFDEEKDIFCKNGTLTQAKKAAKNEARRRGSEIINILG